MLVPNLVFLVLLVTPTAPSGKVVILNQSPVVPLYHHPPDLSICRHSSVHPWPVGYHWREPAVWRHIWTTSRGERMAWESTGRRQSGDGGPELIDHSATTWLRRKRWAGSGACMSSQSLSISDLTENVSLCVRSKPRTRLISVENCPGGSHPAGVGGRITECSLLHVHVEGRQDSL